MGTMMEKKPWSKKQQIRLSSRDSQIGTKSAAVLVDPIFGAGRVFIESYIILRQRKGIMDIFQPSSRSRILDHEISPRLRFNRWEWESRKRDPGGLAYHPHLKCLCSSLAFLTAKCKPGDTVLYVGSSVSSYICTLANMFPMLHFRLFDHNAGQFLKEEQAQPRIPANLEHSQEIFSDQVAARMLLQEGINPNKTLLISDLRNVTKNAWGRGYVAVTDENVINDLHLQENWVQLLRPRSADLKFKLPYHGPSCYSFLQGQAEYQLFGKQSTSETRLIVDAPLSSTGEYAREVYNRHVHDDCMFYHNFVTRMEHMDSSHKIKLSYDQHMAHDIFCEWMQRAYQDPEAISGIADEITRYFPSFPLYNCFIA